MTTLREAIVVEARSWMDTPYKSKSYPVKGHGCDCASFNLGVGMGAGVFPVGTRLPAYSADRHLHKSDEKYHHELIKAGFMPIEPKRAQPGDMLLFVMGERQPASHASVVTECGADRPTRHVHAYRSVGKVRETTIDDAWFKRARFAYCFPGVLPNEPPEEGA